MKVKINNKSIKMQYFYEADSINFCSKTQMLTMFDKDKRAINQLYLSPDFLIDVEIENN